MCSLFPGNVHSYVHAINVGLELSNIKMSHVHLFICGCSLKSCLKCILSDIDECQEAGVCGNNANCDNTDGGFFCTCFDGYNATNPALPAEKLNPCTGTI